MRSKTHPPTISKGLTAVCRGLSIFAFFCTAFFSPYRVAAAFTLNEDGAIKTVIAGHYRLALDTNSAEGKLELWNGREWFVVLEGVRMPEVAVSADGTTYRPYGSWELQNQTVSGDHITLRQTVQMQSEAGNLTPWTLDIEYEVYPEGALFININLSYHSEVPTRLESIEISMPVPDAGNFLHFSDQQVAKKASALMPLRYALGVDERASYTNELEIFIEDSASPSGALGQQFIEDGRATWRFTGDSEPVKSGRLWGYRYENRIAMAMTSAAISSNESESLGARVFHWVNFLEPENWFPSDHELKEMAALGGSHLILHHEWMLYRGSNGYPPADYSILRDAAEFERTVEQAHTLGMKVLLYIRGVELFSIDAPIFKQRDLYDGIYVDWHGAFGNSYHDGLGKAAAFHGDRHFSEDGTYIPGRDYFLFSRRLRELVGEDGSLMGHAGSFNSGVMANLNFDGYLAGETRSERDLFLSREHAVRLGMMSSTVTMSWPEEASVFFEPEGAAKMAAWGIVPHVILGLSNSRTGTLMPRSPDVEMYAPIYRYWNLLKAFDFSNVEMFNHPASASDILIETDREEVAAICYRNRDNGRMLVLVANLGASAASAELELKGFSDEDVLWSLELISPEDGGKTDLGSIRGTWKTPELKQWGIVGYSLNPIQNND